MAEISSEALMNFLVDEGSFGFVDSTGTMRMLQLTLPEFLRAAENADCYWYQRAWHSRESFSDILKLKAQLRMEFDQSMSGCIK